MGTLIGLPKHDVLSLFSAHLFLIADLGVIVG